MFSIGCECLIWLLIPFWVLAQSENHSTHEDSKPSTAPVQLKKNSTTDEPPQHSLADYQRMMCENEAECRVISDLRNRSCMCDSKCPMYNDCCADADHQNGNQSNFNCTRTFLDGNIYMKDKCDLSPSDTRLETLSNYCTVSDFSDDNADIFLRIPVTSKTSNVTYKNLFCALCNNERSFNFWEIVFTPKPSENNSTGWNDQMILPRDQDLRVDFDNPLIRDLNTNAKLPKYLQSKIHYCAAQTMVSNLTEKTYGNADCSKCKPDNETQTSYSTGCKFIDNDDTGSPIVEYKQLVTVRARNIPFSHFCAQIPSDNSAWNLLCRKNETSSDSTELTYIENCFFQTIDGKPCLVNSFFQSDEFVLLDNETVFVYSYNGNFSSSEWELESDNSIYVCGTQIPRTSGERWFDDVNKVLSTVLISVSEIFLILYVALYVTTKKMRYPFGRVIFCYSLTLMATYLVFVVSDHLPSCKKTAAVFHYLFLSCFCWLVVASYDCWRTVTASVTLTSRERDSWRRFLCYCLIGWITPLSIVSVAVYFELSPVQSVACPLKPGYGRLNQCFIAQELPAKYFYFYPSTFMFSIMIYFFLRIIAHVMFHASTHRNFCIFAKVALVTGIPWTIGLLVTLTNAVIVRLLYCVLNSSQGIFIFFALAYDREVVKNKFINIRDCCSRKKSDQNENGRVTFTKTIAKQVSETTMNEYF